MLCPILMSAAGHRENFPLVILLCCWHQKKVLIRKYSRTNFGARDAIFDRTGCQFASKTLESYRQFVRLSV